MTCTSRITWLAGLACAAAVALPLATASALFANEPSADAAANSPVKTPVKVADKTAKKTPVPLFDAIKSGDIEVKYIAKNSREGRLLVKNTTDQPLTVKLPDAFAAVPVLAQQAQQAGGGGIGNRSTRSSNTSKNNQQNQGVGGGGSGLGGIGGGGGGNGGIGGAFDVAPEKVAKINVRTVCLEHGKKEPSANVPYEIRPIESFTSDPSVQELCKMVGSGQINQRTAQAAAWHLANHMTWDQLANKKIHHLIGGNQSYFSAAEIQFAMRIADHAEKLADARASGNASTSAAATTSASAARNGHDSAP